MNESDIPTQFEFELPMTHEVFTINLMNDSRFRGLRSAGQISSALTTTGGRGGGIRRRIFFIIRILEGDIVVIHLIRWIRLTDRSCVTMFVEIFVVIVDGRRSPLLTIHR